jgi:predicted CoA-binding protein
MTNSNDAARGRLLERDEELRDLLARTRTIAVLGIKTEAQSDQPSFYVPEAAQRAGYTIFPVPVYYPEATTILGRAVSRSVAAIGAPVDLVDVFRRPKDLAGHLDDLLAARPRAVWLQQGIRDDAFAERLVEAGIDVVQDRCLMVEIRRFDAHPPA